MLHSRYRISIIIISIWYICTWIYKISSYNHRWSIVDTVCTIKCFGHTIGSSKSNIIKHFYKIWLSIYYVNKFKIHMITKHHMIVSTQSINGTKIVARIICYECIIFSCYTITMTIVRISGRKRLLHFTKCKYAIFWRKVNFIVFWIC